MESNQKRQDALTWLHIVENIDTINKVLKHFSTGHFKEARAVLSGYSLDLQGLVDGGVAEVAAAKQRGCHAALFVRVGPAQLCHHRCTWAGVV
mgnify:CR=1 FL=1